MKKRVLKESIEIYERYTRKNELSQELWDKYLLREDVFLYDAIRKLAHYEELEEKGRLFKIEDSLDEGYLMDWYIHSVGNEEPKWTEAHIEEMHGDFYIFPKGE